ncbi:MAG TPA: UxaA family hydrolase [Burkholderiales bacterium]|nr:UxaA family hydrolase [Burkholderiales bacterium]
MNLFQKSDGSGVLLLAPDDNIAVATAELPQGTERDIGGQRIVLKASVDVGHKFAVRAIKSGSRIVKYGAPIGVATRDIQPGEYVHTHNIASDYLPTYTLEEGRQFVKEAK